MDTDFYCTNHGSIYLLRPLTGAAHDWADEHLPEDGPRMGLAFAVEHRYIGAIVDGILADGLTVE
jgi:hypothetical protein